MENLTKADLEKILERYNISPNQTPHLVKELEQYIIKSLHSAREKLSDHINRELSKFQMSLANKIIPEFLEKEKGDADLGLSSGKNDSLSQVVNTQEKANKFMFDLGIVSGDLLVFKKEFIQQYFKGCDKDLKEFLENQQK